MFETDEFILTILMEDCVDDLNKYKKYKIIYSNKSFIIFTILYDCITYCNIDYLYTYAEFRFGGYATKLLQILDLFCIRHNIDEIRLDDDSDRFGMNNNIYLKNGFIYVENGHPEMIKNIA